MAPKKGKKGKAPQLELKAAPPQKPKKPPPPPACFSPQELAQFKELFKLYDEAGIDKIEIKWVAFCLRKIGLNPSEGQMKELFATFLEDDLVDLVEYHEFLLMIEKKISWGDDVEAVVVESLKTLADDKGETGLVNLDFLKEQLMKWGEPLREEEFVDWVRLAKKEGTFTEIDGNLKYEKFVECMNAKDVRFLPEPVNFFKLDQKTLLRMAQEKAAAEAGEQAQRDAGRRARDEARRQKMLADGLTPE